MILDGKLVVSEILETHTKPLHSQLFLKRNKNNLVIVVGESWSWGDSFKHCQFVENRDDPYYRITHNLGAPVAQHYDSDFILAAMPGGCNLNIMLSLRRLILENIDKYETIRCIIQITEHGRDYAKATYYYEDHGKISKPDYRPYEYPDKYTKFVFFDECFKTEMNLPEYFVWYHNKLYDYYKEILDDVKIKHVFWRGFNRWYPQHYPNSIAYSMSEYMGNLLGYPITPSIDNNPDFWGKVLSRRKNTNDFPNLIYDEVTMKMWDEETQKVQYFNEYWLSKVISHFNGSHPNETTHELWGKLILDQKHLD